MTSYTTSLAIVRALKLPPDPPEQGGPSKIEIAQQAWLSDDIYFPSKDEALAEWILSSFLRDKKTKENPYIRSPDYWKLLSDILSSNRPNRPITVWTQRLLARNSLNAIVTNLLSLTEYVQDGSLSDETLQHFASCFQKLWPTASFRMSLDTLTECFGAVLAYMAVLETNVLEETFMMIVRSYRDSLSFSSSKKKIQSTFISHYISHWLTYISRNFSKVNEGEIPSLPSEDEDTSLYSLIFLAGTESLYSAETLRSAQDPIHLLLKDPLSPKILPTSQLNVFPPLFHAYLTELRKARYAVFATGSDTTTAGLSSGSRAQDPVILGKVRSTGMKSFVACYRTLCERGLSVEVRRTVLNLLKVLQVTNLLLGTVSEEIETLKEIVDDAIRNLSPSNHDVTAISLGILITFGKIDIELLIPLAERIFQRLILIDAQIQPTSLILLKQILDYHCKARTLPTYLDALSSALSIPLLTELYTHVIDISLSAQQAYKSGASGAMLSLQHLDDLAQAIRTYLTPSQIHETVHTLLSSFKAIWTAYGQSLGGEDDRMQIDEVNLFEKKSKKQKRKSQVDFSPPAVIPFEGPALIAVQYSLFSRIIATVFPSLPLSTLTDSSAASVRTTIAESSELVFAACHSTLNSSADPESLKWSKQILCAAAFKLYHRFRSTYDAFGTRMLEADTTAFIRAANEEGILPELLVELLRFAFDCISDAQLNAGPTIDTTLQYLHSYLRDGVFWNGMACTLDVLDSESLHRGAVAVWHLVLDRWLPIIDEYATSDQLRKLANLFLLPRTEATQRPRNTMSYTTELDRSLQSAQLWEFPNFRNGFLSVLDEPLQPFDNNSFLKLIGTDKSSKGRKKHSLTRENRNTAIAIFSLLLKAPLEYSTRQLRASFYRRALIIDALANSSERDDVLLRTLARSWLNVTTVAYGIIGETVEADILNEYFLRSQNFEGDDLLHEVTLSLLGNLQRQTIQGAAQGKESAFTGTCQLFRTLLDNKGNELTIFKKQALLQFVRLITQEYAPNRLSQSARQVVDALCVMMTNVFREMITTLIKMDDMSEVIKKSIDMRAWKSCISLHRWLGNEGAIPVKKGIALLKRVAKIGDSVNSSEQKAFCDELLELQMEETLYCAPNLRVSRLEILVAAYVLILGRLQYTDVSASESALSSMIKSLSKDEFSALINIMPEALRRNGFKSATELAALVKLSSLLIGDSPEGTSRVTQEHFTECLDRFADRDVFWRGDPSLCLEVLKFIEGHVTDKPASLHNQDIGLILLLLSNALEKTEVHTDQSHPEIIHAAVGVTSALIRLRRDLVIKNFPHLGIVLRHLLFSLRNIRPNLGGKHTREVSETLPRWVNVRQPLGAEEARAIARLLTTLQTKTIPRVHKREKEKVKERGKEESKAESLTRPFSKHAPYVLKAYIESMTEELCIVPLAIRKELEPGLYALCDCMTDYLRDSLMVADLDASGKEILKALWKEYEKQKYVGKG